MRAECGPNPGARMALPAALGDNLRVLDTASSIDAFTCAALRGKSPEWPWGCDAEAISQALQRADFHGICALLYQSPRPADWPPQFVQSLRQRAVQLSLWEASHQAVLSGTLAELQAAGIEPVLFKGTALAYSLYRGAVRERGDSDLIIPHAARQRTHALLQSLGWERSVGVSGEFISYQATYTRRTGDGLAHALDLHWKINNSEVLSRLFDYEDLRLAARHLPTLCSVALGVSNVHALLIACLHRATHRTNPYFVDGVAHYTDKRLIWLADIHLLAQQFCADDWREFVSHANGKGLAEVSLDGLEQSRLHLGTEIPAFVLLGLKEAGPRATASVYLRSGKRAQQWMDFRALRTLPDRVALVRELLFPSPLYMRAKFGDQSAPLPWLYLKRVIGGAAKRASR
jgi:hypothetical protein